MDTHITTVVNEPRQVSALSGVDNSIEIDTEQVWATDTGCLVVRLSNIRHYGTDHLSYVLDYHLIRCYWLL